MPSCAGEAALVPELEGEADEVVALGAQEGRDGGGVDSSGHGYGDGLAFDLGRGGHGCAAGSIFSFLLLKSVERVEGAILQGVADFCGGFSVVILW